MREGTELFIVMIVFLLSLLCHGRILNMTFYLLRTLQNMAHYVRMSLHPLSSSTNHGLIKLLVLRALAHGNRTWEQFIAGVGVNRGISLEVGGIKEGDDERSSSESIGGMDRESEDLENVQEEGLGEAAIVANPMEEATMVAATA